MDHLQALKALTFVLLLALPLSSCSEYESVVSSLSRLAHLHREEMELEGALAASGLRTSMYAGPDDAGWSMRVVPFGVSDSSAWPYSRPIPSNKVTVHLGVGPRHGPVPADMMVTLKMMKGPLLEAAAAKEEQHSLDHFATWAMRVAPSYDINIGPGAAGTYVVELRQAYNQTGLIPPLLTMTAFIIEPQHPWVEGVGPHHEPDCADLPAVTEAAVRDAPPVNSPRELCGRYTLNGTIAFGRDYYDDRSDPDKSYQPRSRSEIEAMVQRALARQTYYYGETDTWLYAALDRYPIEGKRVLIIGSNVPWYESICLAFRALECVTVDYNELRYDHPRLKTLRPWDLQQQQAEHAGAYDAIWSISSYEHDGLGRYGDPLNPEADLQSMASVGQYLSPHGVLYLSVPVGRDRVYWNAGRVYGHIRLPLLLKGWGLVESFGFRHSDLDRPSSGEHQPVFVLAQSRP